MMATETTRDAARARGVQRQCRCCVPMAVCTDEGHGAMAGSERARRARGGRTRGQGRERGSRGGSGGAGGAGGAGLGQLGRREMG